VPSLRIAHHWLHVGVCLTVCRFVSTIRAFLRTNGPCRNKGSEVTNPQPPDTQFFNGKTTLVGTKGRR